MRLTQCKEVFEALGEVVSMTSPRHRQGELFCFCFHLKNFFTAQFCLFEGLFGGDNKMRIESEGRTPVSVLCEVI